VGSARFSHDVPAGPELVSPVPGTGECAEDVALPAVIEWEPVTTSITGAPIEIVAYEVIVENEGVNFDVVFPATAGTTVTVPPEVLEPGADYIFEVLAIEEGGNQTITEGCFATAN
jgi:H2-forming N5,N10-methylenetetrahydromethanopterin dehydrogenase-like enzyme